MSLTLDFGRLIVRGRAAQKEATVVRARARHLYESLERFRPALFARRVTIPEAVAVVRTDGSGTLRAACEVAATWLAVPAARLVGMRLLHFVHRLDTRVFRELLMGLGYARPVTETTVRLRARGGSPRLARVGVERVAPNTYEWTLRSVAEAATTVDVPRRPGAPRGRH
jgi:PAS domain-containing protein